MLLNEEFDYISMLIFIALHMFLKNGLAHFFALRLYLRKKLNFFSIFVIAFRTPSKNELARFDFCKHVLKEQVVIVDRHFSLLCAHHKKEGLPTF